MIKAIDKFNHIKLSNFISVRIYKWKAYDNFTAEVQSTGYYHSISIKMTTKINKVNHESCYDSLPNTLQWHNNERDGVAYWCHMATQI